MYNVFLENNILYIVNLDNYGLPLPAQRTPHGDRNLCLHS